MSELVFWGCLLLFGAFVMFLDMKKESDVTVTEATRLVVILLAIVALVLLGIAWLH